MQTIILARYYFFEIKHLYNSSLAMHTWCDNPNTYREEKQ